jgi:hypothetical protein
MASRWATDNVNSDGGAAMHADLKGKTIACKCSVTCLIGAAVLLPKTEMEFGNIGLGGYIIYIYLLQNLYFKDSSSGMTYLRD